MDPFFLGCDYEPNSKSATKQQMIDCYIETLAKVLGMYLLFSLL
jgi:hypothetical protein